MRLVAGAILVLAGAILAGAAMVGIDIRNTGRAPYAESNMGYYLSTACALAGFLLMAVGFRCEQSGKNSLV
jgi:hypothetical protein